SSFFKNGLREELKDLLLARDLPEDFNAFAQLCIKLDNAWHARQMEKKQTTSSRSAAPAPRAATSSPAVTTTTATTTTTAAPRTSTGTAPGPMELDASRRISRKPASIAKKMVFACIVMAKAILPPPAATRRSRRATLRPSPPTLRLPRPPFLLLSLPLLRPRPTLRLTA